MPKKTKKPNAEPARLLPERSLEILVLGLSGPLEIKNPDDRNAAKVLVDRGLAKIQGKKVHLTPAGAFAGKGKAG